ncbi:hypothetical protein ACHAWO_005412 [Cyclotella atomus]|uniref:DDE Tnp4 domain-containing protein n=1 Tax=Cyclotella atomus TaxID=382360 RepID=A0ABD3Q199_9STRA
MAKPTLEDAKRAGVDQQKFFCGRKSKYDVSIVYGGSSSDLLAFEKSGLKQRLDRGLLAATKLVLFGDNAYLNSSYESQLNVRLESWCNDGAFCKYGNAKGALPFKELLQWSVALAKLHNFCIDEANGENAAILHRDEQHIITNEHGSVPLVCNNQAGTDTPQDLIGGGEHFNDVPRDSRRSVESDEPLRALLR